MAYCIRYIFEDEAAPELDTLSQLVNKLAGYALVPAEDGAAEIRVDGELVGIAELHEVPDPGASEEVQDLLAELDTLAEDDDELDTDDVSNRLWNTTGFLRVEVQWEGDEPVESLRKLNPVWPLLLKNFPGLLYADHEGYYDRDGMVLDLG